VTEDRSPGRPRGGDWFTVADGADPATVAAAYRGALTAVSPRMVRLEVELVSDEPWPDEVAWAVRAGLELIKGRRRPRRCWWPVETSSTLLRLDPRDGDQVAVAAALAPYTIGGTGIEGRGRILWSVNDTGTSAAFRLTEDELTQVRAGVAAGGGDPRILVSLERSGRQSLD
jgi:hypothetical protein